MRTLSIGPARRSFIVEPLPPHEAEPGRSGPSGLLMQRRTEWSSVMLTTAAASHCCPVFTAKGTAVSRSHVVSTAVLLHKLQVAPQTLCSRCTSYTFTSVFSPNRENEREAKPRYKQDVDVVWTQSELWWGAELGGGVRGLSESVSRRSLTQSGF